MAGLALIIDRPDRRRALRLLATGGVALVVSACGGGLEPVGAPSPGAVPPGGSDPNTLGSGPVRVGMVLPLSAQGGFGEAARALRNAAELAIAEFPNAEVTILVRDDGGTPEGARAATQALIGEGVELIIGPLMAANVAAASTVARGANRPMIAFSSDTSVAQPGVYLLSFTPQADVEAVLAYAHGRGKRRFAALLPAGGFGDVVLDALQRKVASLGAQVGAVERYAEGQAAAAARTLAGRIEGADALLATDQNDAMPALAQGLQGSGIDTRRVQLLGTGTWNTPSVLGQAALAGGWFAAPDPSGYNAFARRYQARFNAAPTRMATIGYDATALVAALTRTQGANRFAPQTLTSSSGFAGQDGVFRFRADGTIERGLAVMQVANRAARELRAAPRSFAGA